MRKPSLSSCFAMRRECATTNKHPCRVNRLEFAQQDTGVTIGLTVTYKYQQPLVDSLKSRAENSTQGLWRERQQVEY